jgi:hypothetical protein
MYPGPSDEKSMSAEFFNLIIHVTHLNRKISLKRRFERLDPIFFPNSFQPTGYPATLPPFMK